MRTVNFRHQLNETNNLNLSHDRFHQFPPQALLLGPWITSLSLEIQALPPSAVHAILLLHYPRHSSYRTSKPKHLQQHVEHGLTARPSRARPPRAKPSTAIPSGTTLPSDPLRDPRPLHQPLRHSKNPASPRGLTDTSYDHQGRSRGASEVCILYHCFRSGGHRRIS